MTTDATPRRRASDHEPSFARTLMLALPMIALIAGGFWYGLLLLQPPPQKVIVMSTGSKTGGYYAFGLKYQALLAREGVTLQLVTSAGSGENIKRLRDRGSSVSAALIQGGIGAGEDNSGLVSVGRMFLEPVWIFHSADRDIRRLADLKGLRITVGAEGSGTRVLATEILRRANVTDKNSTLVAIANDGAIKAQRAGEVDAVILALAAEAPVLQELLRDPQLKLLSLTEAEALTRLMPYLSKVTLPAGVFDLEKTLPAVDVDLVAPVASLVVRDDLHPALVGLIAKAASELHGGPSLFQKSGEFPLVTDPVFPMSEDAERFYKSGQPLLQRYLPFWLANFVERMLVLLVPIATLTIPIVKGIPALYRWRMRQRIDYWYGRLRDLEARLVKGEAKELTMAHWAELERIDNAVQRLSVPKAYSEAYYNLRSHIDLVRGKLAVLG